ncbi:MFS transporter [Nocardioides sp. C4-1]|uniref:MFS transporter n=1 Tax=Nocardioides sp. C4-1 TaxID=3151851 RepID=UPI003263A475
MARTLPFALAGAAGAATLTAASAPSPLYPVYQRLWGFSAFTLTLVFAVYVFALLAALLTIGSISDHVGRRPVASAALVLLAVGMLLFATADDVGGLMLARVVQGLAVGAAASTTTAMIVDSAPSSQLGSVVSSAVPTLGIGIGLVTAGALVQFAPHPRQLVFWLFGGAYVVLAALVWLVPEHTRPRATASGGLWRSLVPSLGLPPEARAVFLAQLPPMTATWALSGLYLSLGSSVVVTVLGAQNHFVVGLALGAFFVAGVLGTTTSASVAPRWRAWVGYATLTAGVIVTVVATLGGGFATYLVGSVVAGYGFGASFRSVVSELGEAAPANRRGEVFATMYIVSYLAFSVPALVAGLATEQFGLKATIVVYGIAVVALVVTAMITEGTRRRPGDQLDSVGVLRPREPATQQTPRHPGSIGPGVSWASGTSLGRDARS